MTDRLRRLDALFAERVLGLERATVANSAELFYGDEVEAGLPHYTRSLDAAWEATKGLFCCREVNSDHDYVHEAIVARGDPHEHLMSPAQSEDHPAEALVLACLRAVGVDEEELE